MSWETHTATIIVKDDCLSVGDYDRVKAMEHLAKTYQEIGAAAKIPKLNDYLKQSWDISKCTHKGLLMLCMERRERGGDHVEVIYTVQIRSKE